MGMRLLESDTPEVSRDGTCPKRVATGKPSQGRVGLFPAGTLAVG